MTDSSNTDVDCVEMKNQIQQKLQKEWEGLTDAEVRERIHNQLEQSNDSLAQLWRKAIAEKNARFPK